MDQSLALIALLTCSFQGTLPSSCGVNRQNHGRNCPLQCLAMSPPPLRLEAVPKHNHCRLKAKASYTVPELPEGLLPGPVRRAHVLDESAPV